MSRFKNSSSAGSGKLGLLGCRRRPKNENRFVGVEFCLVCDMDVGGGREFNPVISEEPLGPIFSPNSTGSDFPWNQSDKTLALASSFFFGKVSVQVVFFGPDIVSLVPCSKSGGLVIYSVFARRCEGGLLK